MKFVSFLSAVCFSLSSFTVSANESELASTPHPIKQELIAKLNTFEGFSSTFVQDVVDVDGNALQKTQGALIVKRPNLIFWETEQPDETLVVSDGDTLWFYNPFVEQVSAFSVQNAVANTPILLLSDTRAQTWQDYNVEKVSQGYYRIVSLDGEAQVKSLELQFTTNDINKSAISKFTIVDATGQLSHFTLENVDTTTPKDNQFIFTLPEGVDLDDQR